MRNASIETRDLLLNGVKRIATNIGRANGLPEDKLPEVIISKEEATPPTLNDTLLTKRMKATWKAALGKDKVVDLPNKGMGAEDFSYFIMDPYIPSVYWAIGGTPKAELEAANGGGSSIASHHSPFFKVSADSVPFGVQTTVLALMELMGK